MQDWIPLIVSVLEDLGGVAPYSDIYEAIERRQPNLSGKWKKTIQRAIQNHSRQSDGFKKRRDLFYPPLGKGKGVWGLSSYRDRQSVDACDIEEPPARVAVHEYRILRDTAFVRELKMLHGNQCQICSQTIEVAPGRFYSEGHHIQPLGGSHNGPDTPGNVLILCPNHHVLCDYGAVTIELAELRTVPGHTVEQKYLDYHNQKIHGHCLDVAHRQVNAVPLSE